MENQHGRELMDTGMITCLFVDYRMNQAIMRKLIIWNIGLGIFLTILNRNLWQKQLK